MQRDLKDSDRQALRELFDSIDSDAGGSVDKGELRRFLFSVPEFKMTENELLNLFKEADEDGSGEVDYEEFLLILDKAFKDIPTEHLSCIWEGHNKRAEERLERHASVFGTMRRRKSTRFQLPVEEPGEDEATGDGDESHNSPAHSVTFDSAFGEVIDEDASLDTPRGATPVVEQTEPQGESTETTATGGGVGVRDNTSGTSPSSCPSTPPPSSSPPRQDPTTTTTTPSESLPTPTRVPLSRRRYSRMFKQLLAAPPQVLTDSEASNRWRTIRAKVLASVRFKTSQGGEGNNNSNSNNAEVTKERYHTMKETVRAHDLEQQIADLQKRVNQQDKQMKEQQAHYEYEVTSLRSRLKRRMKDQPATTSPTNTQPSSPHLQPLTDNSMLIPESSVRVTLDGISPCCSTEPSEAPQLEPDPDVELLHRIEKQQAINEGLQQEIERLRSELKAKNHTDYMVENDMMRAELAELKLSTRAQMDLHKHRVEQLSQQLDQAQMKKRPGSPTSPKSQRLDPHAKALIIADTQRAAEQKVQQYIEKMEAMEDKHDQERDKLKGIIKEQGEELELLRHEVELISDKDKMFAELRDLQIFKRLTDESNRKNPEAQALKGQVAALQKRLQEVNNELADAYETIGQQDDDKTIEHSDLNRQLYVLTEENEKNKTLIEEWGMQEEYRKHWKCKKCDTHERQKQVLQNQIDELKSQGSVQNNAELEHVRDTVQTLQARLVETLKGRTEAIQRLNGAEERALVIERAADKIRQSVNKVQFAVRKCDDSLSAVVALINDTLQSYGNIAAHQDWILMCEENKDDQHNTSVEETPEDSTQFTLQMLMRAHNHFDVHNTKLQLLPKVVHQLLQLLPKSAITPVDPLATETDTIATTENRSERATAESAYDPKVILSARQGSPSYIPESAPLKDLIEHIGGKNAADQVSLSPTEEAPSKEAQRDVDRDTPFSQNTVSTVDRGDKSPKQSSLLATRGREGSKRVFDHSKRTWRNLNDISPRSALKSSSSGHCLSSMGMGNNNNSTLLGANNNNEVKQRSSSVGKGLSPRAPYSIKTSPGAFSHNALHSSHSHVPTASPRLGRSQSPTTTRSHAQTDSSHRPLTATFSSASRPTTHTTLGLSTASSSPQTVSKLPSTLYPTTTAPAAARERAMSPTATTTTTSTAFTDPYKVGHKYNNSTNGNSSEYYTQGSRSQTPTNFGHHPQSSVDRERGHVYNSGDGSGTYRSAPQGGMEGRKRSLSNSNLSPSHSARGRNSYTALHSNPPSTRSTASRPERSASPTLHNPQYAHPPAAQQQGGTAAMLNNVGSPQVHQQPHSLVTSTGAPPSYAQAMEKATAVTPPGSTSTNNLHPSTIQFMQQHNIPALPLR